MSDIVFDKNLACEHCGVFGACDFGGRLLCASCYQNCGSCCPEFGADDLWETQSERPESTKKSPETEKK